MSQFVPSQRLVVDDSITTGQAVTLEITPASPFLRLCAAIVDVCLTVALLVFTVIVGAKVLDLPSPSMLNVYLVLGMATFTLILPTAIEFLTRGRSLGKWALGLQVVRDDGGVITLHHSFVRAVVGTCELWSTGGSVALITSLLNLRSKRLGDFAAGTMVIRHPTPIPYPLIIMPPDAAPWAERAQVSRLPDALAQRATMFLRDNRSLVPNVRFQTSQAIAAELLHYVEPKPPHDLHPERVIAAILVVNRERDRAKLARWQNVSATAQARVKSTVFNI